MSLNNPPPWIDVRLGQLHLPTFEAVSRLPDRSEAEAMRKGRFNRRSRSNAGSAIGFPAADQEAMRIVFEDGTSQECSATDQREISARGRCSSRARYSQAFEARFGESSRLGQSSGCSMQCIVRGLYVMTSAGLKRVARVESGARLPAGAVCSAEGRSVRIDSSCRHLPGPKRLRLCQSRGCWLSVQTHLHVQGCYAGEVAARPA